MGISRVLLVGEYAGVHRYLRDGLRELGLDVMVAAGTSGWRKNPVDINLSSNFKGILGKIDLYSRPFRLLNRFTEHDIVQFIDYNVFVTKLGVNDYLVKKLILENDRSFLIATGCDHFVNEYYNKTKNSICYQCLRYDKQKKSCPFTEDKFIDRIRKLLPLYDSVIPTAFEYAQSYRDAGINKITPIMPLPINLKHITYKENEVSGKIVIFHGINRIGFKGTNIIKSALKIIQQKFSAEIEVIISDRMPYSEYVEAIMRANIIIDQIFNESFGMNALISMAMGKVVICGDVSKLIQELKINERSPSISVQPSVDDLVTQISKLIEDKKNIPAIGYNSHIFVKNNFDYIKVAEKYIKIWE